MIRSRDPALVHPWLGSLYPHGDHELIGSIDVDPKIRAPRLNGARDVEVLLLVPGLHSSPLLADHVQQCATRIKNALEALAETAAYALQHGPKNWAERYGAHPGPPLFDRLFLDGVQVDEDLTLAVVFDFGDLDQILVRVNSDGRPIHVGLRP